MMHRWIDDMKDMALLVRDIWSINSMGCVKGIAATHGALLEASRQGISLCISPKDIFRAK